MYHRAERAREPRAEAVGAGKTDDDGGIIDSDPIGVICFVICFSYLFYIFCSVHSVTSIIVLADGSCLFIREKIPRLFLDFCV